MENINIAVVDDDLVMLELMKYQFKKNGINAFFFNNGYDFLSKSQTQSFDALLLDHNLPDYNALEIIEIIRPDHRDLKIYVMTGNLQNDQTLEHFAIRADGFLTKPFSPSSVVKKIQEDLILV